VRIPDEEIEERLGEVVRTLLQDPDRLLGMRRSMAALARPEAAERLAALVQRLAAPTPYPEKRPAQGRAG